jgi:hypothetical protein
MENLDLGELKTVSNTLRDHRFEAGELIVGWLMVDGDVHQVAFTPRELLRPMDRAKENVEDLPALGAKPPSHQQVEDLTTKNQELQDKLEAVRKRSLLDRILNTGWKDAD